MIILDDTIRVLVVGNQSYLDNFVEVFKSIDLFRIDYSESSADALEKIKRSDVDCVVFDSSAEDGDAGLVLWEAIRNDHANQVAAVILTEDASMEDVLGAFRLGVGDHVVKKQDWPEDLQKAIRRAVGNTRQTARLLNENAFLAELAAYDRVTGLPNRTFIEDRLVQMVSGAERYGSKLAVLLVDINHFNKINEAFGEAVGNKTLETFGRALVQTLRSSDVVGRFGADEFLVVVDRDVSVSAIQTLCDRLAQALSFSVDDGPISITLSASIGVCFYPSDATTANGLLTAAETAMKAAKAAGGGYRLAGVADVAAPDRFGNALAAETARAHDPLTGPARGAGTPRLSPAMPSRLTVAADLAVGGSDPSGLIGLAGDRRREPRARVFRRGSIILDDRRSIACVIRDISPGGARLSLQVSLPLPEQFSIELIDTRKVRRAVRRWQRGNEAGIQFVGDAPPPIA